MSLEVFSEQLRDLKAWDAIFKTMNLYSFEQIALIKLSMLGLEESEWEFSRGMRTERKYLSGEDIIAIERYSHTISEDKRQVESQTIAIEWLDQQGEVGLRKNVKLVYNKKELRSVNRAIRQERIDYLVSAGEGLKDLADSLPEPLKTQYTQVADSLELMFNHYEESIRKYIERASDEFEQEVKNEQDPIISGILSLPSREPDELFPQGLNVRESILYQLVGAS